MAIISSRGSHVTVDLEEHTNEQAIALYHEAASDLGWKIGLVADNGFVAYTSFSGRPYGEQVGVLVDGEVAVIRSDCRGLRIYDWGKNRQNVDRIIEKMADLWNSYSPAELDQKYLEIRANSRLVDQGD